MTVDHRIQEQEFYIKNIVKKTILRTFTKNGDTKCARCGTWCQGVKASNGKIYCVNCYNKYYK